MSKLPDGWTEWDPNSHIQDRPLVCSDCGWTGRESDIEDYYIHDIFERIDAGQIMPVAECPEMHMDSKDGDYKCGALVHYSDIEVAYRPAPTVLEKIVEATSDV